MVIFFLILFVMFCGKYGGCWIYKIWVWVYVYFKMVDELKVGFFGGGNMVKVIVRGFIFLEMVKVVNIIVSVIIIKMLVVWKVK